jgi:hypothetical protein
MTIEHIVLFKFESSLSEADEAKFFALIHEWPQKIGGYLSLRIGRTFDASRSQGFDYLLHTEFADIEALRHYQQHPVHLEFVEWTKQFGSQIIVLDIELNDSSVVV